MKPITFLSCLLFIGTAQPTKGKDGYNTIYQSYYTQLAHQRETNVSYQLSADATNSNKEDSSKKDNNKKGEKQPPSAVLDKMLKEDLDSKGLMGSIVGGLTLFYNVLSNTLLYPIFSFLLGIMTLLMIFIGLIAFKKLQKQQPFSPLFVIFSSLYVVTYIDLFLVVYEKRKVFFLFLQLEKEIILMAIAAFIGFLGGRFFSSKSFEEKELP